jgi:hypothetical protein
MRRISLTLLAPLALLAIAPLAVAQTPAPEDGALLNGWGLPEDAVLTTVTHVRRNAVARYFAPDADPADTTARPLRELEIFTLRADSVRTTLLAIEDGRPERLEHHILISDVLEDVHEGGEIIDRGRRPNPLSGSQFVSERRPDGSWDRTFIRPYEPTDEQISALREPVSFHTPQYPDHRVRVGDIWEVGREGIETLYGRLLDGAPHRLTYQLDSTGTYLGRPAAFLSYGLDATIDHGDELVMHMNEVGSVVRLLDRFVDVLTQRQGTFRTARSGAFDDGQPYVSVLEGGIRGQEQVFLTIPATSADHQRAPAGSP